MTAQAGVTPAPRSGWARADGVWRSLIRFSRRKPLGAIGALLVVFFVMMAFVGPYVTPHDPHAFPGSSNQAPSSDFWFGTDQVGRDVFSRVVAGASISLTIGFTVTFINVLASSALGLASGYFLGWVDYLIQRSGEAWAAFPSIIAFFLLISIFGQSRSEGGHVFQVAWDMRVLIFALSLGAVFGGSRIIRAATLSIRSSDYVVAAKAVGAGDWWIMTRHVWPNVLSYVIVAASSSIAGVIMAEAALSFLGLGVVAGTPSWGADLSGNNRQYFLQAPWLAIAPGMALSLTVLGFNLFGDALRDVLDPRLRGSGRATAGRTRNAPV